MYKYKQLVIGITVGILIGGFLIESNIFKNHSFVKNIEKRYGMQTFTNPLLECLSDEEIKNIDQLNVSKTELQKFVEKIKSKNKTSSISVYLRDLNNGPWIGIDEREEFIGASLLKVPVLISFMKLAEENQSVFDQEVLYKNKIVKEEQYFRPSKEIEVGKTYKVKDLLEYMIYYSDNNAGAILSSGLTKEQINGTFEAIGLGSSENGKSFTITPKVYAGFFRILFNSSYLSRDFSEATLNLLSQTEFNKGITAKIPSSIKVAHKFGIREENGVKQLHDCGIVYYPGRPYLICIMTKGNDYNKMADSIAEISKFIYDEVSKNI